MTLRLLFACCIAGCSMDTSGLLMMVAGDGGAGHDGGSVDARALDGEVAPDAGEPDGGAIDGGRSDAGPPFTGITDLGVAGLRGVHPAIAWTGTDFAILHATASGGGAHVQLRRMAPGRPPEEPMQLTRDSVPRKSLDITPVGSGLVVSWVEDPDGDDQGTFVVRESPTGSDATFASVELHVDYDDALVLVDGSALVGVARTTAGGDQALVEMRIADGTATVDGTFATSDGFNGLSAATTSRGPLLVTGAGAPSIALRDGAAFRRRNVSVPDTPDDGVVAETSDGALIAVWAVLTGEAWRLVGYRFEVDGTHWDTGASARELGWLGLDPVIGTTSDGHVVAWVDVTSERALALRMIDAHFGELVGRCVVPSSLPIANDPDIACGGGFCAIVWMEGSHIDADDFVVRVMQVPMEPLLVCP